MVIIILTRIYLERTSATSKMMMMTTYKKTALKIIAKKNSRWRYDDFLIRSVAVAITSSFCPSFCVTKKKVITDIIRSVRETAAKVIKTNMMEDNSKNKNGISRTQQSTRKYYYSGIKFQQSIVNTHATATEDIIIEETGKEENDDDDIVSSLVRTTNEKSKSATERKREIEDGDTHIFPVSYVSYWICIFFLYVWYRSCSSYYYSCLLIRSWIRIDTYWYSNLIGTNEIERPIGGIYHTL